MQVQPANSYSQSFKAVNITNVSAIDRELLIRGNLKTLKELGEKYDIRITSCYDANNPGATFVDIDVMPLKTTLNFFKRLFRPIGSCSFIAEETEATDKSAIKEDFINAVKEAITDLSKKHSLHK